MYALALKLDGVAKSRLLRFVVIPAQAGIQ